MGNTIILKNSSTSSSIPVSGDLTLGELAINTADGKVFMKKFDNSVIDIASGGDLSAYLQHTNGITTGIYETIVPVPALNIDVSAGNIQTKTISADSTFTFSGWTANSSAVLLELTATGSEVVTFTGATFKPLPILANGLTAIVFSSTDGGSTINGYIARDGS